MYCENCGEKLNEDDAYCGNCGTPVKKYRIPEKRIGNGLRFLRCLDVLCSYWQYLQEAQ